MTSRAAPMKFNQNGTMIAAIVIMGILMTLKYFPGLENEAAYAGNAFQVIYPEAFAGDPYRNPETPLLQRPLQLSLMYVLVKVVGELWLDDRFLAFVYLGLVVASLLGIDRIACLLGIKGGGERLLILMMFAKDHQILTAKVMVAHHQDVNHSAFAIPIIIWLMYSALARKGLLVVLTLSLLLVLTSVRHSMFMLFFVSMIVLFTGTRGERQVMTSLIALGILTIYGALFYLFPIAEQHRLNLWDIIKTIEGNDSDPFAPDAIGPMPLRHAVWLLFVGSGIAVCWQKGGAFKGVLVVFISGLIVWAAGGLYINFAPDFLKYPFLISFVPARALPFVQNLAYIAILVHLMRLLERDPSFRNLAFTGITVAALFVAGPGNLHLWAGLLAAGVAVTLAAVYFQWPRQLFATIATQDFGARLKTAWRGVVVFPVALTLVVAYGVAFYQKLPAWKVTFESGVHGLNPSADWIGIAEYFRYETPPTTMVLTFKCSGGKGCQELHADRTLAVRSGRPMVTPEIVGGDFQTPESWKRVYRQKKFLNEIGSDFVEGNLTAATSKIKQLPVVPDYLVLPNQIRPTGEPSLRFPYEEEKRFSRFTVYKRLN